jgi:hypothetical protein
MMLFSFQKSETTPIDGLWGMEFVVLNGDTIFSRYNFDFTLKYNLRKFSEFQISEQDSMNIIEQSQLSYSNIYDVKMFFHENKRFSMTNLRSGGIVDLDVLDTGMFEFRNDSVFISISTRNDKKMLLLMDRSEERLFVQDGFPEHMVLTKYVKLSSE